MRKHNRHNKYPAVRRAREPWTKPEHELFMEAVFQLYGCNWRLVTQHIKTRRREQVRSHAQKIFEKMRAQGEGHLIPPRCSRKREVPPLPDFFPPLEEEETANTEEDENDPQPIDVMSFFKDDAFY